MKSIRDTCMEFFQSEDMKRDVKLVLQPMFGMVYNELYPYLWFLCIYHVFLIFIVLANLVLLLRRVRETGLCNKVVNGCLNEQV